jgi:glycosyltransferase involved in cell wall biosynthesis
MSRITILTPTLKRPLPVLERCFASVNWQTLPSWEHVVCSDGCLEPGVAQLVERGRDPRRRYTNLTAQWGHFGAGVRGALLPQVRTEYVAFLDDDNILFPRYCERMVQALDGNSGAGFAICQIVHWGPLPPRFGGLMPVILTGIPPETNNIDTLQVVARTAAIQASGWVLAGYLSDGKTYERLGRMHPWVAVDEVLAIHV